VTTVRTVIQMLSWLLMAATLVGAAEAPAGSQASEPEAQAKASVEKVQTFARTFATHEELFDAIEFAVTSGDPELLRELAVSETEFRHLVWPTLDIASRPKSNFTWEFVWSQHQLSHEKCVLRTSHDYAGQEFEIVGIAFNGRTTDHGTFKIYRESEVEIERPDGSRAKLELFGSLLETADGRYKVYSFIND
jgi:hypothetical protein